MISPPSPCCAWFRHTRYTLPSQGRAGATARSCAKRLLPLASRALVLASVCLVQNRIGARHAAAFDLSAGCSGFLYGLACAVPMLQTGLHGYALVIGVDTLSKITDFSDRLTCVLFGDGAGAVVLGPTDEGRGFLAFELGADGSGGPLIRQEAGGSRLPVSYATVEARQHCIAMSGQEVFKFAVRVLGTSAEAALKKAGLDTDDIDLLIPHQANIRIIETAIRRLGGV